MPKPTTSRHPPPDPLQQLRDDPHDYVGSLFDEHPDPDTSFPSAPSAISNRSAKSRTHAAVLGREQDRSAARVGRSAPGNRSARDIVMDELKDALWFFIRSMGVGAQFQSVDFLNWLDAERRRPADTDMRCLGGLWNRLISVGILEIVGHAPNGGGGGGGSGAASTYNSTTRPVFRVLLLDATRTGWFAPAVPSDRSAA